MYVNQVTQNGDRWSSEAAVFLEELAYAKARSTPKMLHYATVMPGQRRWARLLVKSLGDSVGCSLKDAPLGGGTGAGGGGGGARVQGYQ